MENIKEIYYCKNCGYKSLENRKCKVCNNDLIKLGPIYIGKLYDENILNNIRNNISLLNLDKDERKVIDRILNCDSKLDLWYYYDIRKISSFYKNNLPKIEKILEINNGCRTHFYRLWNKNLILSKNINIL
jgi:N2,N2-dimethylguanosine tRNA methyltransferase